MIEGWIPCRLFLNLDINACVALMIFLVFEEGGLLLGIAALDIFAAAALAGY